MRSVEIGIEIEWPSAIVIDFDGDFDLDYPLPTLSLGLNSAYAGDSDHGKMISK